MPDETGIRESHGKKERRRDFTRERTSRVSEARNVKIFSLGDGKTSRNPFKTAQVRLGTRYSVAYTFGGGSLVLRKNASRNSNAFDNVDGVLPGGWGSSGITGEMSKTTICTKTDFEFHSFGFFFLWTVFNLANM